MLLKIVQEATGPNVKELYTMASSLSDNEEDFIVDPGVYSGIYWVGLTAYQFVIDKSGFKSDRIN